MTATLNPENQRVVITSTAPLRDLAPGSLQAMCAELEAWSGRCDSVLASLEEEMRKVRFDAVQRARRDQRAERQIKGVMEAHGLGDGGAVGEARGARGLRGSSKKKTVRDEQESDEDAMDVDSNGAGGPGGSSKRGMGAFAGKGQRIGR